MPLSEEELRLLDQMERALVEEDPKFASTLRGTSLRQSARRRAILAGACFVVGIVVMMGGVISSVNNGAIGIGIGIVGFVIMLAAGTVALTAIRGQQASPAEPRPTGRPGQAFTVIDGGRSRAPRTRRSRRSSSSGSFTERMEARWRRRREQNGGM